MGKFSLTPKTEPIHCSMLQEETLAKKFIHRGFWLYLFTFLSAPLGYIIKSLLSHDQNLDVSDIGVFYGIISIITILSAINDLGCTESLNYFLPKYILEQKYGKIKYLLKIVATFQIISSLLIISILWFFSEQIAEFHFKNIHLATTLKIMALFFIGNNILHICTALFSATQNTKLSKSTEFIRLLGTTIFTLMIFILDIGNLELYAYAWISGIFVAIFFWGFFTYKNYYLPYLKNIPTEKDTILRKQFIKYAFPTFLTANISLLLSQIDAQLVIILLGNEAHWYYSNYLSVMTLPFIVLSPIIAFLFPVFTELYARKDEKKIHLLYSTASLYLLIMAIWASYFLFQNGIHITKILFWEKFLLSGEILQYSVPFMVFIVLVQLNFQLLAGTWQAWARTLSFWITLPINIILNIFLIKTLGVQGSALAVGISWIPLYGLTLYFLRKYITLPPIIPILYNIFGGLIAYWGSNWIWQNFANTYSWFIISVGIYAIIFLWINASSLKNFLRTLKSHKS